MITNKPSWDRRHHPRAALEQRVEVRLNHWLELEAWGRDVSYGGMRLQLPTGVMPGERLTVGLALPSELCLALDAEVSNVRVEEGSTVAGLRWLEADHEVLDLLIEDLQ